MDALFNGIAAVVEGLLQFVWLLFASLFRLGSATDSQLSVAQRRRHLTAGLLGIGVIVVVIATVAGFSWYLGSGVRGHAQETGLADKDADISLRPGDVDRATGAELVEEAMRRWRRKSDGAKQERESAKPE